MAPADAVESNNNEINCRRIETDYHGGGMSAMAAAFTCQLDDMRRLSSARRRRFTEFRKEALDLGLEVASAGEQAEMIEQGLHLTRTVGADAG